MTFLAPLFLLLALPALLLWVGPLAAPSRVHAAIRTAAWLLVVLALARPVQVARGEQPALRVAVIDRSASVPDAGDEQAAAWLAAAAAEESFARWVVVELAGEGRAELTPPDGARHIRLDAGAVATPLGQALAAAARVLPAGARDARVTVLTDGLATGDPRGADQVAALDAIARRGAALEVVELPGAVGDLRAVGLDVPGGVRAGREVTALARVVGGGQSVTCTLLGPDGELASSGPVIADGEIALPLTFAAPEPGFLDLRLEVAVADGVDPVPGDLSYARTLPVDPPLEVLYLGGRVEGAAARLGELLGDGFEVREAGGETSVADARVVVLDDRPARDVPAALQSEIAAAVTAGTTGLLAAGGEAAFGPGGYHEEPIEELLPVEFVQKEEKRDPSTTLVVIIDTSGSMGGNRVQLAKEVSRLAIRRLLPHDKVGMVEFYGAKRWAVPIQPASNSIEIERALNRLDAGGGTVILPAIEEAYYGLKNVRTRYKHVLILTDGGVETGAFEPLLRRMADDGMNVSTVLIGPNAHSEFLVNIANWGQGRFYSVPNRFNLPEILLKQPATAKLPAYRPGLTTVRARGGRDWWGELDAARTPPVGGYVETTARSGAEVLLETAEEAHPILASWRYGLGRVTALTTELVGPGTEPWSGWDGYGELLARAVERTASDDAEPFAYELVRVPRGVLAVAEVRPAFRGADLDAPTANLDGDQEFTLGQVAPDRYERLFPVAEDEGLRLTFGAGSRTRRLAVDPLAGGARERQVAPAVAAAFAARVAAATPVPVANPAPHTTLREWAPFLALLALLAYLGDVAFRRWPRRAV